MKPLKQLSIGIPALWVLAACVDPAGTTEEAVGGDYTEVAGTAAYSGMEQLDQGTEALAEAANLALLTSTADLPGIETGTGPLAKSAAESQDWEVRIDSSDTANGVLLVAVTKTRLLYTERDSIRVRWDEQARDGVEGNENVIDCKAVKEFVGGRVEEFTISDLDGDGVVNGNPEFNGAARLAGATTTALGVVERGTMAVDAGADRDFDGEGDNKILSIAWTRSKDGTELASAEFDDADGDGYVVDNASAQPSLVDVRMAERGNPHKPWVQSSSLEFRVEKTPGSRGEGRILSLSAEEVLKNGRINRIWIEDPNGGRTIEDGEFAHLNIRSTFPGVDSLIETEILIVLDRVNGLNDSVDNRVHEVHATSEKRFGPVAREAFHFVATEPVPLGQEPTSGTVEVAVDFRSGDRVTLSGTFTQGSLEATVTTPNGTKTVQWNPGGRIVS